LAGALDIVAVTNLPPFSTYTILSNTGPGAVNGTFVGLPQNAVFQRGGYNWRINYQGGSGNDVVLTLLAATNQVQTIQLVASGATWRYLDLTNDPGTAWRSNGFSDITWLAGASKLGFGITNGTPPTTTIASNGQMTTYFRHQFVVPDPALVQSLSARLLRDDGAVVYLNGAEVWRDNMPAGTITNLTPASVVITGSGETTWLSRPLGTSNLVSGTNLLAVEIHQNSISGNDLSFDFELAATAVSPYQPTLKAAGTSTNLVLSWPGDAGFYEVNCATNLVPPVIWTPMTDVPIYSNGWWFIQLAPQGTSFFRLQSQ
jgi:hypothetical protein